MRLGEVTASMVHSKFSLTANEAAYIVAALRLVLDRAPACLTEHDREIINRLMLRLAAQIDLSDEVNWLIARRRHDA